MIGESLVVMERGARFPNWIDTMTGIESNVRVLAQRDRESQAQRPCRANDPSLMPERCAHEAALPSARTTAACERPACRA